MRKRGERHVAKGAQAVTQTRGRRREDKPSAHGTPALPTELNSAPCLLPFKDTFVSIEEEVKAIHLQKCDEGPQQVEVAEQQQQEDQGGAKKLKISISIEMFQAGIVPKL